MAPLMLEAMDEWDSVGLAANQVALTDRLVVFDKRKGHRGLLINPKITDAGGTSSVQELNWYGRRVDLATLTRSATACAFELKLRDNGRALEQAALNALSFDRSYVVTATPPTAKLLRRAEAVGVGVIHIGEGPAVAILLEATPSIRDPLLRPRLLKSFRMAGVDTHV
jgi:hypothetical protein